MMTRVLLALCAALALAACAPRASLSVVDIPPEVSSTRSAVFVATSRTVLADDGPDSIARGGLGFAQFEVSIPPSHQPGQIRVARSRSPDPREHMVVSTAHTDLPRAQMQRALARAFAESGGAGVLYVHGFNNVPADGVFRIAQLSHDLALDGVRFSYSWPSLGSPLGYAHDRDSALYSRDALADTIALLVASGGRNLAIVAHSMGGHLTMEALRTLALSGRSDVLAALDGVVLIAPDIDVDVFRAQASAISPLPRPFLIFASRQDRALRLSARLSGAENRLGTIRDLAPLEDLPVTVLDVSAFDADSSNSHFVVGSSPQLLSILNGVQDVDAAFQQDGPARTGLLPGTVLTVQNATQIILSPVAALGGAAAP